MCIKGFSKIYTNWGYILILKSFQYVILYANKNGLPYIIKDFEKRIDPGFRVSPVCADVFIMKTGVEWYEGTVIEGSQARMGKKTLKWTLV